MIHMLTTAGAALLVRHWFEIDLEDASMEHGCRVELREVARVDHRGSESAAQVVAADRPLWRADLFDRLSDEPGTFAAAHFHPYFEGNEPCVRVWDDRLTADPWGWLREQVSRFGSGSASQPAPLGPEDAAGLRAMADEVVAVAQRFSPARCASQSECYRLTRDARQSVRLMVEYLQDPSRLDKDAVSLWTEE
jgi:hypothetical protein